MSQSIESGMSFRSVMGGALRGVACLALSAVALAAVAQENVITFGTALSLTGKMSPEGSRVKEGYDLYVKQINARGGIKVGDKTTRSPSSTTTTRATPTRRSSSTRS